MTIEKLIVMTDHLKINKINLGCWIFGTPLNCVPKARPHLPHPSSSHVSPSLPLGDEGRGTATDRQKEETNAGRSTKLPGPVVRVILLSVTHL